MSNMWDGRYSSEEYAYGISPNEFFKEILNEYLPKGSILLPAEGEGRNAVYAAKKGLNVSAFDLSVEGQKKALKLAEKENVKINYEVGDFFELDLVNKKYDAAALIYAHFPVAILSKYHRKIADLIKLGGIVILEGFSKGNLPLRQENPEIGGPNEMDMLFSKETIQNDFLDFDVIKLEEVEVELKEGIYHNGKGKVIRFVGRKRV
jgi:hypothetical protein